MKKLIQIINSWDPIGLFPMAPENEYYSEINKIYEYLSVNHDIESEDLAKTINTIFIKAFGVDVYEENLERCKIVAKEILNTKQL